MPFAYLIGFASYPYSVVANLSNEESQYGAQELRFSIKKLIFWTFGGFFIMFYHNRISLFGSEKENATDKNMTGLSVHSFDSAPAAKKSLSFEKNEEEYDDNDFEY